MTEPNANAIAIVGAACRLPGAPNEAAFRDVLNRGLFTVGTLPSGRWHPEMLFNPDVRAPGSAYTFNGGYLSDPYAFDIGAFGMSPREAAQVDPQQRVLAEVVWEALEDARISPTSLQGKDVGVYIGVSALDHANLFGADPLGIESHFMTGNTLSVVANRISYLFDLRGPSFVVDTACSSSLVAVDRALADLASGRIDTAIVGGVNMLLSPGSFVGFSRASMLSPTGACRPFSAQADGYVRAEGAVVFVLRRQDAAVPGSIRALIAGSAVNSDGRTSGIALPGLEGQRRLLELAYRDVGFGPEDLDFVEAHGTGTAVGDPIEATAIGEVLGRGRSNGPLPVGSVKSNIGHLEPASGAAGMLKALIALEQRELPATLHLDELNPNIDFARLNLAPAAKPVALGELPLRCGVSSFGFGGTNAHVVMTSAPAAGPVNVWQPSPEVLTISAHCREALAELAGAYARRLDDGVAPRRLAASESGARALLRHRAVLPLTDAETMTDALQDFARGKPSAVVAGTAPGATTQVCFVYSGNGSQWAGMGRAAYAANRTFARAFDQVDECFAALGFPSLAAMLQADDLADQLAHAAVAQPLLFAIQVGISAALGERGLRPDAVLGHSVGEISAAWAAGAFTLEQGARIIAARAQSQEAVRGIGGMATLGADRATVTKLIEAAEGEVCIAAENAPTSFTIAGDKATVAALLKAARRQRVAGLTLPIDYPYHSPLLDSIHGHFLAEVGIVSSKEPRVTMISTVTGEPVGDAPLDAAYWWRNIRNEVRFRKAVETAAARGANLFVEIGPRSILAAAVAGSVEDGGHTARVITSLGEADEATRDPIAETWCRAVANGFAPEAPNGGRAASVDRSIALPAYPWQRKTYRYTPSASAIDVYGLAARHPLLGARIVAGGPEWRSALDGGVLPFLADHVVGDEVVLPATALAEMALAAARELWPQGPLALEDFDVLQALVLAEGTQRELSTVYSQDLGTIEIRSRTRPGGEEWTLHARGRIARAASPPTAGPAEPAATETRSPDTAYANASRCGIEYGPAFRLIEAMRYDGDKQLQVTLAPAVGHGGAAKGFVLHPASLDAALHSVFALLAENTDRAAQLAWLPIRFGRLVVAEGSRAIAAATLRMDVDGPSLKIISIWLHDADGAPVARLEGALLRAVPLGRGESGPGLFRIDQEPAGLLDRSSALFDFARTWFERHGVPGRSESALLLRAHMRSAVYGAMRPLADETGTLDLAALAAEGRIDDAALPWLRVCLGELAAAGLLDAERGKPVLAPECALPEPDVLLAGFAAEAPQAATDLLLSGLAARAIGAGDVVTAPAPRAALVDRAAGSSIRIAPAVAALAGCLRALVEAARPDVLHVIVAEANGAALIAPLAELAASGAIRLSLAAADRSSAERVTRRLGTAAKVEVIDLSQPVDATGDVLLAIVRADAAVAPLSTLLRPSGVLITACPRDDALAVFQGGSDPALFGTTTSAADDRDDAAGLGASSWLTHPAGDLAIRIACRVSVSPVATTDSARLRIEAIPSGSAAPLRKVLRARAAALKLELEPRGSVGVAASGDERPLVCIVDCAEGSLEEHLLALRDVLADLAVARTRSHCRIAAIARGPAGAAGSAAIRAFARVAANEYAGVDIGFVELGEELEDAALADAIIELALAGGQERDSAIAAAGHTVARLRTGLAASRGSAAAARLEFPRPGMIEAFDWVAAPLPEPGPGEVVIAIEGTGLNFRDVMLAMGLLNDDVLEGGQAGAVYGLECAGRVVALGEGATMHRIGDAVFGFGSDSFATHVVAHERSFAPVPPALSIEAAAGLPVAFLTAWYSLVELARLRAGERVLIHGGAGGVGLAAIQIAAALGAEVIATVSSPDKDAVARLYGAAHIYDSRSLGFAEAIAEHHGGVDVVLNSLSGDAMRASLKCLRPRGRFVELGKRDYVANSAIGLRPFRRNLSYFGVDVDQLLADEPTIAAQSLSALVEGLADGRYLPLPTMVHRAGEAGEAFRLMQASGHVGKIVVVPPPLNTIAAAPTGTFAPGQGVQLVIGGTRGFGLATALWLAERGAQRIVVASRAGKIAAADRGRIAALRKRGVVFAVEQVDVTDLASVKALIARINDAHGLIGGIFHAAVTLRDGLLEGLEADALAAVLAPKAQGAANLDRASRDQPIEQFVLFSSVSALVGNPGQGAYAAANGYLEGLARQRRAAGFPAVAVQWGAIADVGLLADRADTMASLARASGITAMQSAEALAQLGTILAHADTLRDPVVACAQFAPNGALHALPVAATPTFAPVFAGWSSNVVEAGMSLAELIAGKSEAEAQRLLGALVAEEVAQILRLATHDVDLDAPIDSLGMDSLMALELRMSIETRYDVELPVMAITAAGSLRELSHRILRIVQQGGSTSDPSGMTDTEGALLASHGAAALLRDGPEPGA